METLRRLGNFESQLVDRYSFNYFFFFFFGYDGSAHGRNIVQSLITLYEFWRDKLYNYNRNYLHNWRSPVRHIDDLIFHLYDEIFIIFRR